MQAARPHIQEVGVLDGDAREQVELVGALGGVPGHVVGLDVDLPRAEAPRHQQERGRHGRYDEEQLHSTPTASVMTLQQYPRHQQECGRHGSYDKEQLHSKPTA